LLALPDFTLVTGNRAKVEEAERITGRRLDHSAVDLPEIQSLSLEEVLRVKGEEAWRRLGRPLVVEETGLELAALGGFPGPLVKWMLCAVGVDGIARVAHAMADPRATARCAILYRDAERTVVVEGAVSGTLVSPPRGGSGFGWDPAFRPDGETATCGELPPAQKDAIGHRGRAWRALSAVLAPGGAGARPL